MLNVLIVNGTALLLTGITALTFIPQLKATLNGLATQFIERLAIILLILSSPIA